MLLQMRFDGGRWLSAPAVVINPYAVGYAPSPLHAEAYQAFVTGDTDRSNSIDWAELKIMLDSSWGRAFVFPGNLCRFLLRAFSTRGEWAVGATSLDFAGFLDLFEHIREWQGLFQQMMSPPTPYGGTPQVLLSTLKQCLRQQLPADFSDMTIGYILDSACESDDAITDHAISFQRFVRIQTELQLLSHQFARVQMYSPAGTPFSANEFVRVFFYAR